MRNVICLDFLIGKGTFRLIPGHNPAAWFGIIHFGSISSVNRKWKFSEKIHQRFLAALQAPPKGLNFWLFL